MKKDNGVTLVELLLAIGISIFLYSVISVYLMQVQKLSHRALHSQELMSDELGALSIVLQDLRSASRTSIGNLVLNGDFEDDETPTKPRFWANSVPAGSYEYLLTDSTITVHNGFHSIDLQGSPGSNYYDSTKYVSFTAGAAYMLSVWVKSSDLTTVAKVSLIDNANFEYVSSAPTSSTNWQQILVRIPTSGPYVLGSASGNKAKIRLTLQSGSGVAYFDDIGCSMIQAVFVSTNAADVNVPTIVSDLSDPSDGVGYRFIKCDNGIPTIYRYRIGLNNGFNYLVREKFDTSLPSPVWTSVSSSKLAVGVNIFKLFYDPSNALPPLGKDAPLTAVLGVTDKYSQNQSLVLRTETVVIKPVTP